MKYLSKKRSLALAGIVSLSIAALAGLAAQPGPPPAAHAAAPQHEAFKNLKVLNDVPPDQIIPAMQFISASLGVECEYCHVRGAFEKDDKEPKQTAREMIQMEFAINKQNFDGHREVTCNTCHRGNTHPTAVPAVGDDMEKPPAQTAANTLPAPEALVAKYVDALGGANALHKISSRVEKGTVKMANGTSFPVEVFAEAPNKRMSIMHMGNGDSITAYDGQSGWLANGSRPARDMNPAETESARVDADFYFPLNIAQTFNTLKVTGIDHIDGHEVYAVVGRSPQKPPVRLYFDTQSGLLSRMIRYVDSPLGLNPVQVDYADYREKEGAKTPFQWTISRPGSRFVIQVDQIQQNVPIDGTKFARPAQASAAPPQH